MKKLLAAIFFINGCFLTFQVNSAVLDFSAYDYTSNWTLISGDTFASEGIVFDTQINILDSLDGYSDSGGAGITTEFPIGDNLSGYFTGSVTSVDYISVWIGDQPISGTDIDTVLFEGFDINGNLVDSATYTALGPRQLSISGAGIVSFQFTGYDTITSGLSVAFDDFTFNPEATDNGNDTGSGTDPNVVAVPEPSGLALLVLGLVGFLGFGKSKNIA